MGYFLMKILRLLLKIEVQNNTAVFVIFRLLSESMDPYNVRENRLNGWKVHVGGVFPFENSPVA
jgi:hypothetical protein